MTMSPELFQSDQSKSAHLQPLRACADSWTTYPRDSTVAQIFEEIARSHANSTALMCGEENISYGELNTRANRLANRLRDLNVGPETLVGCCLERSVALIVSLLAILKAGGAYVPIDPAYPRERFELLLADARPAVMLTQRSLATTVLAGYCASPLLFVDDIDTSLPASNPEPAGSATSLAYVMYTSGSTGVPKGVMVENRSIVRLVKNTNFCRFSANEVFLQFAPVSFDASTFEIWGALLNGARLVIMPPTACSLQELGRVIRSHGVTTLWLTAGLFNLMVEERLEDLRSVRQLLAGGDVLSPWHVQHALENLSDCRLINGYGPTENTTFTCCHQISRGDDVSSGVPIGRPISNSWIYILDQHLRPAPVGTTGELYAAGDGLARGYLNNPRETADKFVLDPFATEAGSRMYRTGDLGRWRPDGTIEFLGRTDNQIKILGYRVEPGEVEAALQTHHALKQVCVVALTDRDGSKRLAAYYMILPSAEVGHIELREFLQKTLPSIYDSRTIYPTRCIPAHAQRKD